MGCAPSKRAKDTGKPKGFIKPKWTSDEPLTEQRLQVCAVAIVTPKMEGRAATKTGTAFAEHVQRVLGHSAPLWWRQR